VRQVMLGVEPHHQPGGVPAAGNQAAELRLLGGLRVGVHCLRIVSLCEFNDLVCLDRDAAEAVNVAFDIVFEVAIIDGV